MSLRTTASPTHLLFTGARPEAFADSTRSILGRLGYRIFTADELACFQRQPEAESSRIEMLLLDEHRLEAAEQVDPEALLPIVLLTGRAGIREPDSRIVAAVKRPAGLHDLYRIFQGHFEVTPRTTPRVETNLEVTCRRRGKTWSATVRSLSDTGCLLRSDEAVPLGSSLNVTLSLPVTGAIDFKAEVAYQLVPDLGLVFNAIRPQVRAAISSYVCESLASG